MANPANATVKAEGSVHSNTPYQLDLTQTTKACTVLQKHIADFQSKRDAKLKKPNLLSTDADADPAGANDEALRGSPFWMIVTGKRHIVDRTRLKPHKVTLPHPPNAASSATICLITADPQRLYKDVIADAAFPKELRARITRIIGLEKLKSRYKSFETKRQLASEHDLFLADSRVWTYLPKVLGKVFFHGGAKRPIPVEIGGPSQIQQKPPVGKSRQSTKGTPGNGAAKPQALAKELEKAINSAIVHLTTANTSAVKVSTAALTPVQSTANIQALVEGMTSRLLPQGWRGIRAIHIKGPNTPSLPIWLASELWTDENDVIEKQETGQKRKRHGQNKRKDKREEDESARKASAQSGGDMEETKEQRKQRVADQLDRKAKRHKIKEEVVADVD